MLTYSVNLTTGITESFFEDLKQLTGRSLLVRKRLTEITIELLQNIIKHSTSRAHARLIIQKQPNRYVIQSINNIHRNDVAVLQDKINLINSLNSIELKQLHTLTLGSTSAQNNSGAGLGLYRIAMRSSEKLTVSFKNSDSDTCRFSIYTTLTTP